MLNCNSTEMWSTFHQAETYLTVSREKLAAGNTEGSQEAAKAAEAILTEVIGLNPSCWAYAHRGEAFRLQDKWNEAKSDFQKAIDQPGGTSRNYAWAYAHWGETLRCQQHMKGKEAPEGREKFTQAISLDPDYAWAYAHRGATYEITPQSADLDVALRDFSQAIKLYDENFKDTRPEYCSGNGYAWARAWQSVARFYKLIQSGDCSGIQAFYDLLVAVTVDPGIIHLEWRCEVKDILQQHNVTLK